MNLVSKTSLRFRLVFLIGVVLIPIALLLSVSVFEQRDQKLECFHDNVIRTTEQTGARAAQVVWNIWQTLVSMSASNVQITNSIAANQYFSNFLIKKNMFCGAGLAQADGLVIASSNPAEIGSVYSDQLWFQTAQQKQELSIGGYEIDKFTKKECIKFAIPIVTGSGANRVSVMYINLGLDTLMKVFAVTKLPKNSVAAVLDRNGTILTRWPDNQGYQGKKSSAWEHFQPANKWVGKTMEWVGIDKVTRYYYYFLPVPSSNQGLWVGVGVSKTEVHSQTSAQFWWGFGAFGLVLAFSLFFAWFGSESWILHPVRLLTKTAHRLASGDWKARTRFKDSRNELEMLGYTFDEMADSLEMQQVELRRTQFAVDRAPDMILWTDPTGRFIYGNESSLKALKVSLNELLEMRLQNVTDFITPATWQAHWEELKNHGSLVFEATCRTRSIKFPVEAIANYLVFGDREYDCVFLRDISRRKHAEDNLRRLNAELEIRVQKRTAELEATNASLLDEINERHKAEESLRESQRMFATLLSNLPGLAYRCRNDVNWTFEFVSQGALELTGYAPDELINNKVTSFANLIHPEDKERIWAETQLTLARHEPFRLLYRINSRNGRLKWVSEIGQGVFDASGKVVALEGIIHDTTERKQVEEEIFRAHAMLETVLDHIPQRVFWKDMESRYLGCNKFYALDNQLENPQDIVGRTDFDLFSDELAEAMRKEDRWVTSNNTSKLNYEESRKTLYGLRWFRMSKMPLHDLKGNVVGILSVYEDISEQRKMEETLQESLRVLERSNKELEQFAYVASHDLQEPLRLVSSYTQLLALRYKGKLDDKADEFIGYAVDGARRMQQLILDLLAFSRVGNKELPFVSVDCDAILEQAIKNLSMAIHESKAAITHDRLPTVMGIGNLLGQLFQNLIGNAIKFHGNEPPQIHIGVRRGEKEKDWVFYVRDNGIGIAPEFFERIFVIFQRLHSRSKYEGTGIGLAICKRIVERHGGRIWVESELDRGSTFYFTIPERHHS